MAIPPKPARTITARERHEWLLFALLVGPNLLLFGVFTYWPLLYNIYLSFIRWNFLRPRKPFVWLDNYRDVFSSAQFWTIMGNTLTFTVCSVGLTLLLGLSLALLLNQPLRYRNTARAVLFSPTVMAGAVVAVVWSYIFDPHYGLIDKLLGLVGLSSPDWLGTTVWAMPAVIIVYVWKNLGYAVVIYLAGLQGIPRELYDAARVDGAGPWARFRHVTLPGLSPVAFFLSVTSILATFQSFDIIKVLTDGGPVDATSTLIYHLYELGFVSYDAGKAGVVAVVLFTIMLVLTLIQLRYLERRIAYG
ncbi:MAG: sugar ABC transporter permease [Chloroflexales bacterium]|nr:sugar ABC transporter permease [Chloroflexales bacterium]